MVSIEKMNGLIEYHSGQAFGTIKTIWNENETKAITNLKTIFEFHYNQKP